MTLDRVHTSESSRLSSYPAGSPVISTGSTAPEPGPAPVTAAASTPLLRRCTALAAQARVELLTESRRSATAELDGVLREIETWAPEQVQRSEEHTSELQSRGHLVCRLLLEKKKKKP